MATTMTQDDLKKFVVQTLKDTLGSDLATVVRDQLEKAMEPVRAIAKCTASKSGSM